MALGGRAAENITFSRITTGAQNDLEKVTKIAHALVAKYGMNKRIGPMYVPDEAEYSYTGDKPYSKALGNIIDEEVRNVVQTSYSKTETLLRENQAKLIKVCLLLLLKMLTVIVYLFSWLKRFLNARHLTMTTLSI